jgi:hypothetical protein
MYHCCILRSLEKKNSGKNRAVNGRQEGVSENCTPPTSIVGEGA